MGAGIAQVCCQAGFETHLVDADPAALKRAVGRITEFWDKGIAKGKTTPEQKEDWLRLLKAEPDLPTAARTADLVIEAIPEIMELKRKIFSELDHNAPKHVILATNTSSLSVKEIASATKRPGQVVGLHFFNPVPLMQLLEIVRHDATDSAVLKASHDFGAKLGKTTILVRDSPGFATSRLGIVLGNEAMRMLDENVASAKDIDTAMKLGYGHPMGPLELSDLIGLDVRLNVGDYLYSKFGGEHYKSPHLLRRLVASGAVGKKSGKGFYDWSSGQPKERQLP